MLKCRTCLGEYEETTMFDLFEEHEGELSEKIELCCGVKIPYSIGKPRKICMKCFEVIQMWFNFREICINSQVYLEFKAIIGPAAEYNNKNIKYCLDGIYKDLQTFSTKEYQEERVDVNLTVAADLIANEMEEDVLVEYCESETEEISEIIYSHESLQEEVSHDVENLDTNKTNTQSGKNNFSIEFPADNVNYKLTIDRVSEDAISEEKYACAARKGVRKRNSRKKNFRPSSPSTYMCALCANIYSNKASFNYHMNSHADLKPHECELCGKKFQQTCQFKAHMRRHTGEKPYKCDFCDRCFYDPTDKLRHQRTHTNEKPYKCNVCGKSFSLTSSLRAHEKLHDKEKAFRCFPCGKSFTLRHQLTSHRATKQHIKNAGIFAQDTV